MRGGKDRNGGREALLFSVEFKSLYLIRTRGRYMMSESEMAFMIARANCSATMFMQPSAPLIRVLEFQRSEIGLQEKMEVCNCSIRI